MASPRSSTRPRHRGRLLANLAFRIGAPLERSALPALCGRLGALLGEGGVELAIFDVGQSAATVVTLDALASLRLVAGRHGCSVMLRRASPELLDLIAFAGLADVLPSESRRQAEQRK